MNQHSRFALPPNIQQHISNKQNLHSMQNINSFNNNIQNHSNNQQQPFNQQTQNLYQQTSQQNNYLQTSQHNNFQQQPQLNYQIHQHWDQQTLPQAHHTSGNTNSEQEIEIDDFPIDDDD